MDQFEFIEDLGDGTYGTVRKAINRSTNEIVAIKKMKRKYYSWDECLNLPEVKSLRKMKNHPNIVKLHEVIRQNDNLYFVFECMECNLYDLMKGRDTLFPESKVRNWCFQLFQAIAYMHQQGYFHRDLKPENLLVKKDVIKIGDFGLARELSSQTTPFTEYVATRWYRAPEVLLQSPSYGSAIDMWAMGAIMAELFTLRPLFPGSSEADQMYKICSVIGSPNQQTWSEGLRLAASLQYRFPQFIHDSHVLSTLIPTASPEAIDLIASLCSWDPKKRPTAAESLKHPFFQSLLYIPPHKRPNAAESLNHPFFQSRLYIPPPLRVREPIIKHQISSNKCKRTYAAKPCWQKLESPSHMKTSRHPSDVKKHHSLYTAPQRRVAMKRRATNEVRYDKSNGKRACYRLPMNKDLQVVDK